MDNIRKRYGANLKLLNLYKQKGSILKGDGIPMGNDMMENMLQNFADYLAYIDRRINFENTFGKLKLYYNMQ